MRLDELTDFLVEINSIVDEGQHQDVSMQEVEEHITEGDLLPWLGERVGRTLTRSPEFDREITDKLQGICGAYQGRERNWGIKRSGLCLPVAWTAELLKGFDQAPS
jgi:hypothetical protein